MRNRITLITPTCDRPFGVALAEKYVKHQGIKPFQWIVADGGKQQAPLTMGQERVWNPGPPGVRNFTRNLQAAIPLVRGDIVIFIEDDDVYLPHHFERVVGELETKPITGSRWLNYYHLQSEKYYSCKIPGSSLSQTAFKVGLLSRFKAVVDDCHARNSWMVDNAFWQSGLEEYATEESSVYGLKAIPGVPGLGIGHRPDDGRPWKKDINFVKLREWIGELADPYISVMLPKTSETENG